MRETRKTRQRRSAAEMQRWLDRRSSQGWTWGELSKRSGVPRSTLMWWSRRLQGRSSGQHASGQGFVQADIGVVGGERPVRYHIQLASGHELSLESGFVADEVRALVRALAEVDGR